MDTGDALRFKNMITESCCGVPYKRLRHYAAFNTMVKMKAVVGEIGPRGIYRVSDLSTWEYRKQGKQRLPSLAAYTWG